MGLDIVSYAMGMSDKRYASHTDVGADMGAMKNMVNPEKLYSIPFDIISKIDRHSIICGPDVVWIGAGCMHHGMGTAAWPAAIAFLGCSKEIHDPVKADYTETGKNSPAGGSDYTET